MWSLLRDSKVTEQVNPMADEFDRASELEEAQRQEAISRVLARKPGGRKLSLICVHCEELPCQSGSVNCLRCNLELTRGHN